MSDFEMLHIDMDSFFVSVERRDDPELFGKPVIVGGKGYRAVVSSASYEARTFGIRSGMSLVKALKMCPQAIYIYGDYQKYIDSARAIYSLLRKYSPRIEFASIDEAYIDLHGTQRLNGHPIEVAQDIHDRINQKLHLPCSIGLGSNKIMAKIGSNMAKPEGLVAIKKGFESAFLAPLSIDTIPFLGKKTKAKLNSFGISKIGDLQRFGEQSLIDAFGKVGTYYYQSAFGRCFPALTTGEEYVQKTISKEYTFHEDTSDTTFLLSAISYLTEFIASFLHRKKKNARTFTIKIRYKNFDTVVHSYTPPNPTSFHIEINSIIKELFHQTYVVPKKVRLIGVAASNFTTTRLQTDIFSYLRRQKVLRANCAQDRIKEKHGFDTILHGMSLAYLRNHFHSCPCVVIPAKAHCVNRNPG